MVGLWILLAWLLVPPGALQAATYGIGNEPATTVGHKIASSSGSGTACSVGTPCTLAEALSQATAGQTILLRAGTYSGGTLTLTTNGTQASPVLIKPFNGELVNLPRKFTGGRHVILAGVRIVTPSTAGESVNLTGMVNVHFRNVYLEINNSGNAGVVATGELELSGSEFVAGQNDSCPFRPNPGRWSVHHTRFTAQSAGPDFGDYICTLALWNAGGNVAQIYDNVFESNPDRAMEQYIDMKSVAEGATGGYAIYRNLFKARPGALHEPSCFLIWAAKPGTTVTQHIANNFYEECFANIAYPGHDTPKTGSEGAGILFELNMMDCTGYTGEETGRITVALDNVRVWNNTLRNCTFDINDDADDQNGVLINPVVNNLQIQGNVIETLTFTGDSAASGGTAAYSHNNLRSVTGTPGFAATNSTTVNPGFVNTGTRNFNVTHASLMQTAHNGKTRGALQPPQLSTCNVGTVSPSTMTMAVNTSYTVLSATHTRMQAQQNNTPMTTTGATIQGATQVSLATTPFSAGTTAELALTVQGALVTGQCLGGPEFCSGGESIPTTSDLACTNTVQSSTPFLSSCLVTDAARSIMQGTFNTVNAGPMQPGNCPVGWTATGNAVANNPVSCVAQGLDQIRFTVGTPFTAGPITLSYDSTVATSNTRNSAGAGVEVSSGTVTCLNQIGQNPPAISTIRVAATNPQAFVFTFDIGSSDSLQPATGILGLSCREDVDGTPTAVALVTCSLAEIDTVMCFATHAMTQGDTLDCSYTPGVGNLTNESATPAVAFTNMAVANEVQPPVYTVTLVSSAGVFVHEAEATARGYCPEVLAVTDPPCTQVAPAGSVRMQHQLRCNVAGGIGTCPAAAYVPYVSRNGAPGVPLTNTFGAEGVKLGTDQVVLNLTPTTPHTGCTGTFTAGVVYLSPLTVFTQVGLGHEDCVGYGINVDFAPDVVPHDTYLFGMQVDGGGQTSVVQQAPLTIVIGTPGNTPGGGRE